MSLSSNASRLTSLLHTDPLPDFSLPKSGYDNLGVELFLEGNEFAGQLSVLDSPSLEVLIADNNHLQGGLHDLSNSNHLKILSLEGNRLKESTASCIGDSLAAMPLLQQINIGNNLFNHSNPCNVLSAGERPYFLQGVVELKVSILDFCSACDAEQMQSNCALGACIDVARKAAFTNMILEAILQIDTPPPPPATDNPTTNPTSGFYSIGSVSPTAWPSDVGDTQSPTTANPTTANPSPNPTANPTLDLELQGAVELLRLEPRGSGANASTFATFRLPWPTHASTTTQLMAAHLQSKLRESPAVGLAEVYATCRPGLLGETCRYVTQLNWRRLEPGISIKEGFHPLLTPEATLAEFALDAQPSHAELFRSNLPWQDVYSSEGCHEECVGNMAAAFQACRPSLEAFHHDPTHAFGTMCDCHDLVEVAEESCSVQCFDSILLGIKQLLHQERWRMGIDAMRTMLSEGTTLEQTKLLMLSVQGLRTSCLNSKIFNITNDLNRRVLLSESEGVPLAAALENVQNDLRAAFVDQCSTNSTLCIFENLSILNASVEPSLSSSVPAMGAVVNRTSFIAKVNMSFSEPVSIIKMFLRMNNLTIQVPPSALEYVEAIKIGLSNTISINLTHSAFARLPSLGGGSVFINAPIGGILSETLVPNREVVWLNFSLAPNGPLLQRVHPARAEGSRNWTTTDKALYATFNEAVFSPKTLPLLVDEEFRTSLVEARYNRGNGKNQIKYLLPSDYWVKFKCAKGASVALDVVDDDGVSLLQEEVIQHETFFSCGYMRLKTLLADAIFNTTTSQTLGILGGTGSWMAEFKQYLLQQLGVPSSTVDGIVVTSVIAQNPEEVTLTFFLTNPDVLNSYLDKSSKRGFEKKLGENNTFLPLYGTPSCFGTKTVDCGSLPVCFEDLAKSSHFSCTGGHCGQCYKAMPSGQCQQSIYSCSYMQRASARGETENGENRDIEIGFGTAIGIGAIIVLLMFAVKRWKKNRNKVVPEPHKNKAASYAPSHSWTPRSSDRPGLSGTSSQHQAGLAMKGATNDQEAAGQFAKRKTENESAGRKTLPKIGSDVDTLENFDSGIQPITKTNEHELVHSPGKEEVLDDEEEEYENDFENYLEAK